MRFRKNLLFQNNHRGSFEIGTPRGRSRGAFLRQGMSSVPAMGVSTGGAVGVEGTLVGFGVSTVG